MLFRSVEVLVGVDVLVGIVAHAVLEEELLLAFLLDVVHVAPHHEGDPLVDECVGCGRPRCDVYLVMLVAPQELELLNVVVLDDELRHLVLLGVDVLALVVVGVVVAVLVLAQV